MVSHSRALADAAVGLAMEMVAGRAERPVVAVAAGLDATTFGTNATAVAEAIGAADGPDGVLVLLDLGSALLSTDLALELVEPGVRERVLVTSAPLVEGLVAAVVLATAGAPLGEVADEARHGLAAKQDHLGDAARADSAEPARADYAGEAVELVVPNPHGLHARPAARLVALVRSYDATATLTNLTTGRGPVNAASLSLVATLDARQGHRIRAGATGPDAAAFLAAVTALAHTGFGDQHPAQPGPTPRATPDVPEGWGNYLPSGGRKSPQPDAVAQGSGLDIAIGPAVMTAWEVDLSGYEAGDAATEQLRSERAVEAAAELLGRLRADTAKRAGEAEAAIFDAHLALLDDPELTARVAQAIAAGSSAPQAWTAVYDEVTARFDALADPYQRVRAFDVQMVRREVLYALLDPTRQNLRVPEQRGILVVPQLDPATAARVDPAMVLGIATRTGGATGHGVIVARSRGIPVITDIGDTPIAVGTLVAFDARTRRFVVDPDEPVRAELEALRDSRAGEWSAALAVAHEPAVTRDGHVVRVLANVGSVDDAVVAEANGAEGSGLVRTEVLFGDRAAAPSADEQAEVYGAIAAALDGPVTIRTWDAGGDKPLPFLPQPAEPNPFLGERGLRVFRHRPELLGEQLTAICRVARTTRVRVLFPMVSTVDELAWVRAELAALDPPDSLEVGIMVEVPAAALRIDRLAAQVDFVSIGTNDLTQYTLAADRGNAAVAELADALDPAVLALVRRVTEHVADVAVCGDLASDPDAAVLLAGLGVRELSVVALQVPLVKARLRAVRLEDAAGLAAQALAAPDAASVRRLLEAG